MATRGYNIYVNGFGHHATLECVSCGKPLASGRFLILAVLGNEVKLVGPNPPIVCCDEATDTIFLFDQKDDAIIKSAEVESKLQSGATDKTFRLVDSSAFTNQKPN